MNARSDNAPEPTLPAPPSGVAHTELLAVHPLLSSTTLLPTAQIEEVCALARRIVLARQSGCYFVAPSGFGKTSCLMMVAEFLMRFFSGLIVISHFAQNQPVPSIRAFFKHFLRSVGHAELRGETYDLRSRTLDYLVDLARLSPYHMVVLLFDEAQMLNLDDLKFLKDIHNDLAKHAIAFVTILMGQSPEFQAVLKLVDNGQRTDLHDRFVRHEFKLRTFRTVHDFEKLLREVDHATFPPGSSCSWTGFFFPKAVAAGFTLESQALAFHQALATAYRVAGKRLAIPARPVFEALRAFCLDNAAYDGAPPTIPADAWHQAVHWAEVASATGNTRKRAA